MRHGPGRVAIELWIQRGERLKQLCLEDGAVLLALMVVAQRQSGSCAKAGYQRDWQGARAQAAFLPAAKG